MSGHLVTHPLFRWLPGMTDAVWDRVLWADDGGTLFWVDIDRNGRPFRIDLGDVAGARPDLGDPATCGCLEALAREAWSPVGCGRTVEIEVAARCRYDEHGQPVPAYAVRVLVLCDTWRLEWEPPREQWQPTRGLALAEALLAAPIWPTEAT